MNESTPLAYEIVGAVNAPVVMLLHPICANRRIWDLQVPVWAAEFRLLLVDLPGHGESPLTQGPATLEEFARRVIATMDSAGVRTTAVVGLSLGAMVAQWVALRHPDRVTRLVLANAGAFTPEPVRALWAERLALLSSHGFDCHVDSTIGRWFSEEFRRVSPRTVNWVASMVRSTSVEAYRNAVEAIQGLDNLAALATVTSPTLVVAGGADAAVAQTVSAEVAKRIQNASLATLTAGHISNVERSLEFTEVVGAFLSECQ